MTSLASPRHPIHRASRMGTGSAESRTAPAYQSTPRGLTRDAKEIDMSKNHGRRIIDTVRNEDLREKTRSALYDIIAEFIRQAPMEARDMGLLLEAKKPGKDCRGARAKERRG